MLSGISLQLLVGPTVPLPAPVALMEALQRVEVTHTDEGRSGFQLSFGLTRSGPLELADHPALTLALLKAFNRVILVVQLGARPRVLMDGFVTHHELVPDARGGGSVFTVTGEDVSVVMDLEERSVQHPAQDETMIANKIILSYAGRIGLLPKVIPPLVVDPPVPVERTPVQTDTDLRHLCGMAARFGYVCYVTPGPLPGQNVAYWGPPTRTDLPQPALSIDLGTQSNVDGLRFRHDALTPTVVRGQVQDRLLGAVLPVATFASTRLPPLSLLPTLLVDQPDVRTTAFRGSGLTALQAIARAQGTTDAAADSVTAEGELDAVRYGDVLQARGTVGVRGAGVVHDGLYYVKRVSHQIAPGSYRQRFTLTREGLGTTVPAVRP